MQQMAGQMKQPRPAGPPRGMGMPDRMQQRAPKPEPAPEEITFRAKADLLKSTEAELASIVNAFNGGYLYPSPGGDPVLNPRYRPDRQKPLRHRPGAHGRPERATPSADSLPRR